MNKISIIVPVYNAEKYLRKCCYSILEQKYKDIELILINDGSTDDSEKICKQVCLEDSRVMFKTINNQGVSVARNVGIDCATGKYIMFVDSDDWLEPKSLESISEIIESEQDVYVLNHWQEYQNNSREIFMNPCETTIPSLLEHLGELREIDSLLCTVWNKVYKCSLIKEKGIRFLENIPFGEDFLFNMDFFMVAENLVCSNIFSYHYNCMNLNSATHKLKGRKVNPNVSLVIAPGSRQVMEMIARNGALADIISSGARILENSCGPCIGMGQAPSTNAVSLRTFIDYIRLMYHKIINLIRTKEKQNTIVMKTVFEFILERYEYALQGCLENDMTIKNKCSFLKDLVLDMDVELRRYAEASNYEVAILVRNANLYTFDVCVIKMLLKKYFYRMKCKLIRFLKGRKNGK